MLKKYVKLNEQYNKMFDNEGYNPLNVEQFKKAYELNKNGNEGNGILHEIESKIKPIIKTIEVDEYLMTDDLVLRGILSQALTIVNETKVL